MHEMVHILNGDSLHEAFPDSIPGERIIFREMMMEGPANGDDLDSLISLRKDFFSDAYQVSEVEYDRLTSQELLKISEINAHTKVYLWFVYDLFCQINMWCVTYILTKWNNVKNIYIIYPGHDDWKGFAVSDHDLILDQYKQAYRFSDKDILNIQQLWEAYTKEDWQKMRSLMDYSSDALPRQKPIIQAQLDRISQNGNPGIIHSTIKDLVLKYGKNDFRRIFQSFSKDLGHYGMGDLQIKRLVDMY